MHSEVKHFSDLETMSQAAAKVIAQRVQEKVNERGLFTLVLSGGNTPRLLYEILSAPPFLNDFPWSHIHFFWGDERAVPKNYPESNFGLADQNLLSRIKVPKPNIHRIPAEKGEWAAGEYEREIQTFFDSTYPVPSEKPFLALELQNPPNPPLIKEGKGGFNEEKSKVPSFDLVLLGLGRDGHTASLFPGDPALEEKQHWTAWVPKPGQPPDHPRITLTLPILNQAEEVLFLVAGQEKQGIFRTILENPSKAQQCYPAARVRPKERLSWFITISS